MTKSGQKAGETTVFRIPKFCVFSQTTYKKLSMFGKMLTLLPSSTIFTVKEIFTSPMRLYCKSSNHSYYWDQIVKQRHWVLCCEIHCSKYTMQTPKTVIFPFHLYLPRCSWYRWIAIQCTGREACTCHKIASLMSLLPSLYQLSAKPAVDIVQSCALLWNELM